MLVHKESCESIKWPKIDNGTWEYWNMTQNSTIVAKYKCNVGFSMKDSEFRHCSPEGIFDLESQQKIYNKWTGNKPECIGRKKCTFHKIFQLEIVSKNSYYKIENVLKLLLLL